MPEEGVPSKSHDSMLSLEEIASFARIAAGEGFKRIRLTGGEPLVRLGIEELVTKLRAIPGVESIAMTTNGILLPKMAKKLKEAGLSRVNISLDTLDPDQYHHITRWGNIKEVHRGIDTALELGFRPVKINVVVVRSLDQDLLAFVRMSLDRPLHVRFIEYMPVGGSLGNEGLGWTKEDTIPNEELIALINQKTQEGGLGALEPLSQQSETPTGWGPARYYQLKGAKGTVGFISALSRHFCSECNRMRLTVDGQLLPCLFSNTSYDVKAALRSQDLDAVGQVLRKALASKPSEHHHKVGTEHYMSQIGG